MKKLASANVCRSGKTARTWNFEDTKVQLDTDEEALQIFFSLRSKGGGVTEVKLTIGVKDFPALTAGMVSADRPRALREMAATLASELTKQADYEAATLRRGRESVYDAADLAWHEAPAGRDHAERLARDMVRQLIDNLNEHDSLEPTDSETV